MSKTKKYKYDIAISFAEEERDIAALLDTVFRLRKFKRIHAFYYPKFKSELLGEDLDKILPVIYEQEARYALIILSDRYLAKDYCKIELAAIKKRRDVQESKYAFVIRKDKTQLKDIGFPKGFVYYPWNYDAEDLADTLVEILDRKPVPPVWLKVVISVITTLVVIVVGWLSIPQETKPEPAPLITLQDTLPEVTITGEQNKPIPKPVSPPLLFLRDIATSSGNDLAIYLKANNSSQQREFLSVLERALASKKVNNHRGLLNELIVGGNNFNQLLNGNFASISTYHPQDRLDYIIIGNVRTTAKETPGKLFWREITLELSILNLKAGSSEYLTFKGQSTSGSHDNAYKSASQELLTNIQNEFHYEF